MEGVLITFLNFFLVYVEINNNKKIREGISISFVFLLNTNVKTLCIFLY